MHRLAELIEKRYRTYLQTTFYLKDSDLRRSFHEALATGHLMKGPYLESVPLYRQGISLYQLATEILGDREENRCFADALGDLQFHAHQEQAIRAASTGFNAVVATGTGSGKTEAFIFPILFHLYAEMLDGCLGDGIRALILYPMNALANDQRERIGELCRRLSESRLGLNITFGQYIGETPQDESDRNRNAYEKEQHRQPGELIFRNEMRKTPPNILLTNYSMLEYLLLRPDDSPLFDNGMARSWKYIVLDEAHQYRGSKGIEMAMLLRRLKQRLRQGGRDKPFTCIATSATLAKADRDKPLIAKFATDLFGEPFESHGVILGETDVNLPSPTQTLAKEDYEAILACVVAGADEHAILESLVETKSDTTKAQMTMAERAGNIMEKDTRACELRSRLAEGPVSCDELAGDLFPELPEEDRTNTLFILARLLSSSKDIRTGRPLLNCRYHAFLRSLEGAFVSLSDPKQIYLDRKISDEKGVVFEVAICRECGQHYLVGKIRGGHLEEANRDPSDPDFGATFFRPVDQSSSQSKGESDEEANDGQVVHKLCLTCGSIYPRQKGNICGHATSILVEEQEHAKEKLDQVPKCSTCGYRGQDPIREVVHGSEGPHSVIATTIHQALEPARRKVLAFADGRQEAAFFAWYLENSYSDLLSRSLMLDAVRSLPTIDQAEGASLSDMVARVCALMREGGSLAPYASDLEVRRKAWSSVYRELLTEEKRICLEGVGLVRWSIKRPDWLQVSNVLADEPWKMGTEESWRLVEVLLKYCRDEKAIEIVAEEGVQVEWDSLGIQGQPSSLRIGRPQGAKEARSWDGPRTRRTLFLAKLLRKRGFTEGESLQLAISTLRKLWDEIRLAEESITARHRLLVSAGNGMRINPGWWRANAILSTEDLFECEVCGRIQTSSIDGVCPGHGCMGSLGRAGSRMLDAEGNHYRLLYQQKLPLALRAEEHTAQLSPEKAREFQMEFKRGDIHVLSCSTTFELGVDLGDLDVIFLRNVPPEAFNYTQRVGRAGRRSGFPGFAVTYCKRGPHDLYHFAHPDLIMNGAIRPPALSIINERIVKRHLAAVAFSHYFRTHRDHFRDVGSLMGNLQQPSAADHLGRFLRDNQVMVLASFRDIVPSESGVKIDLDKFKWIDEIVGNGSRFVLAQEEVANDYQAVQRLEKESRKGRDYRVAEWAKRRMDTISSEDVLSFLSRKAVIPKYGFPVDVVELDIQRTGRTDGDRGVSLQRDLSLAISEFAPGSKLIANKRLWVPHGIKRVAGREWERKEYFRCRKHNFFRAWNYGEAPPSETCCRLTKRVYIVPQFGFQTDYRKPQEPKGRPYRMFTSRPYFLGLEGIEPRKKELQLLSLTRSSPGRLLVLCEGRHGEGFAICSKCGAGVNDLRAKHTDALGRQCNGTVGHFSLAHEFVTDVLRIDLNDEAFQPGISDTTWLAYSVAFALLEGAAEVLEIPPTDINATIATGTHGTYPGIILYDSVPGGAGLVAALEEEELLRECIEAAFGRVSGACGCDEHSSCYGCLRSYRNQFAHQHLVRGLAQDVLLRVRDAMA